MVNRNVSLQKQSFTGVISHKRDIAVYYIKCNSEVKERWLPQCRASNTTITCMIKYHKLCMTDGHGCFDSGFQLVYVLESGVSYFLLDNAQYWILWDSGQVNWLTNQAQ